MRFRRMLACTFLTLSSAAIYAGCSSSDAGSNDNVIAACAKECSCMKCQSGYEDVCVKEGHQAITDAKEQGCLEEANAFFDCIANNECTAKAKSCQEKEDALGACSSTSSDE